MTKTVEDVSNVLPQNQGILRKVSSGDLISESSWGLTADLDYDCFMNMPSSSFDSLGLDSFSDALLPYDPWDDGNLLMLTPAAQLMRATFDNGTSMAPRDFPSQARSVFDDTGGGVDRLLQYRWFDDPAPGSATDSALHMVGYTATGEDVNDSLEELFPEIQHSYEENLLPSESCPADGLSQCSPERFPWSSSTTQSPVGQGYGGQRRALPRTSTPSQPVSKHRQKHACPTCREPFTEEKSMKRHIESKHGLERPYSCPHKLCTWAQQGFNRKDSLQRHMRRAHGIDKSVKTKS